MNIMKNTLLDIHINNTFLQPLLNNKTYEKQNTKPNKQKQNHKLKFLATKQTKVV